MISQIVSYPKKAKFTKDLGFQKNKRNIISYNQLWVNLSIMTPHIKDYIDTYFPNFCVPYVAT